MTYTALCNGQCRVAVEPLEATVLIQWRAPYATGHEATVPAGTRLRVTQAPPEGTTAVACEPIAYAALEAELVAETTYAAGRYAGYWLSIDIAQMIARTQPFDPHADAAASIPQRLRPEWALIGSLLGTAVGDAIGLPLEGMSRRRVRRLYRGHHQFFLGRGMISDDTEHAAMAVQSLTDARGDPDRFTAAMARRLRLWLLGLPVSTGRATLRACMKLWLGFGAHRSGVYSAGNGPAMRAAQMGVAYGGEAHRLRALVRASTRITHTDPDAERAALAVAIAAHCAATHTYIAPRDFFARVADALPTAKDRDFLELLEQVCVGVACDQSADDFAGARGQTRGIGGYALHTVPVVLHVWLRHQQDFEAAISEIVCLGGDTDTTAAILGGIVGASVGKAGIPAQWLENMAEWPRTTRWLEAVARALAGDASAAVPRLNPAALALRNFVFTLLVLAHGFRRMLPPYG